MRLYMNTTCTVVVRIYPKNENARVLDFNPTGNASRSRNWLSPLYLSSQRVVTISLTATHSRSHRITLV
jgi:hypothetical protein